MQSHMRYCRVLHTCVHIHTHICSTSAESHTGQRVAKATGAQQPVYISGDEIILLLPSSLYHPRPLLCFTTANNCRNRTVNLRECRRGQPLNLSPLDFPFYVFEVTATERPSGMNWTKSKNVSTMLKFLILPCSPLENRVAAVLNCLHCICFWLQPSVFQSGASNQSVEQLGKQKEQPCWALTSETNPYLIFPPFSCRWRAERGE